MSPLVASSYYHHVVPSSSLFEPTISARRSNWSFSVFTLVIFCSLNLTPVQCKIYERCELARELKQKHDLPLNQLSTWLCIVKHESVYNTSAVNRASGDHGLFQISDIYWCSVPGAGLKACDSPCSAFEDDDITDDVACVRRIFKEHTGLSGDGFNAWVVYPRYCQGDVSHYLQGCFENEVDSSYNFNPSTPQLNQTTDEEPVYEFPPLPKPPKLYENRNETNEITPFNLDSSITEVVRQTYLTSTSPAAVGRQKTSLNKFSTGVPPPSSVEVDKIKFIPNVAGTGSSTLQPSTGLLYYSATPTFPYKSESTGLPPRPTLKSLATTSRYHSEAFTSQPEPTTRPTSVDFASRIGSQPSTTTLQPGAVYSSVAPVSPSKPEGFGVSFRSTSKPPKPIPTYSARPFSPETYPSTNLVPTRIGLKPSTILPPSTAIYGGLSTVPARPELPKILVRTTSKPSVPNLTYSLKPLPLKPKPSAKFASIDFASRTGLKSLTTFHPSYINSSAGPPFPFQSESSRVSLRPNLKTSTPISAYFPRPFSPALTFNSKPASINSASKIGLYPSSTLKPSYLAKKPELKPTLKPFQPFVSSNSNTKLAESYKFTKSPSIAFKPSFTTSTGKKPQASSTTKPYYLSTARASPFKRILSEATTTRKPTTKSYRHFSTLKPFSKLVENARHMNLKREQKFHGFGNSEYTFVWRPNGFKLMLNPK